jgi:DNA-binding MarR family transcriptional regulator
VRTDDNILAALRQLLIAYERVDASWRHKYRLNANQRLVLMFLAEGMSTAPTDLSRAIGMTTAGMTGLVDRLEVDGYVRRERDPADGRRLILSLTKQGLRAHMAFEEATERLAARVDHYTSAERAAIHRFLTDGVHGFTAEIDD